MEKLILKELMAKEQVVAPCIWDCMSAKAAELSGYKALMLSSTCLANSMLGMPDFGLMNVEEVIYAVERIAYTSPLPVILDGEDGYGESPLLVYRNVQRIAKAGAQAITIDDSTSARGWERLLYSCEERGVGYDQISFDGLGRTVLDADKWYAKLKAAVAACEGTNCLVIARTHAYLSTGLEDSIERCVKADQLGVPITLCYGIGNLEQGEKVAKALPGWKMWGDDQSKDGVPQVSLKDAYRLGFNLVTNHCLESGAMWGMMMHGVNNVKNGNTVFSDTHDVSDYYPYPSSVDYRSWLKMEKEFNNVK